MSGAGSHGSNSMAGMNMGGAAMAAPSATAAMVCSTEISDSVMSALALAQRPTTKDTWSAHLYTCTYTLPSGDVVFSVKDSSNVHAGMAYFKHLQGGLDAKVGVHPIKGLAGLGLPSFESKNGHVVFIKDGKTLHVDASNVSGASGQRRTKIAYQLATDVVACWSE